MVLVNNNTLDKKYIYQLVVKLKANKYYKELLFYLFILLSSNL